MKHLFIFIFIFSIAIAFSCNEKKRIIPAAKYPVTELNDLESYYAEWSDECEKRGVKDLCEEGVTFAYSDTLTSYGGWCLKNEQGEEVIVKSSYQNTWMAKVVLYHELGHCCLNLSHDTVPGIMSPHFYPWGEIIYINNWDKYLDDYFNRAKEAQK